MTTRRLLVVLAALAAFVGAVPSADAAPTRNPWSIGLYRGSLHRDYLEAHERWLGRPIQTVLEMIPTDGWKRIDDPRNQLKAWAGTAYDIVFTTPMLPRDGVSTLAAGADGAYDEHWRRFAKAMIDGGRPNARIRLGHEFNHTHYPWTAAGGKEASFAAYYRRIVTVMRAVPGARFRFTWNVLSGVKTADVERAYPGDAYVDVIGLDLYDGAGYIKDVNERWRKYHTQPYGLDWLVRFASAHKKPMAFDEWALIKSNDPARRDPKLDSGDDTVFINGMIDFFESHNVVYANYFDVNTQFGSTNSRIMDGPYPNASATYLARVRATPGATTVRPATVSPPLEPSGPGAPGAALDGDRVATVRDAAVLALPDGAPPGAPVVAGAVTPTGRGAWTVTAEGRLFRSGDALDLGSPAGLPLRAPIVGLTPTPTGRGYWLVAADGGVFTYGDAGFFGSTSAVVLNQPVVGLAATASGRGYWVLAADGGVFAFGDAPFFGSAGALELRSPMTAMAVTPSRGGYWLLGADGGVFAFGDAPFFGSTGADPAVGAIGAIVPSSPEPGYWLLGRDGRLHPFGDAP
jgi:hypothetical protein